MLYAVHYLCAHDVCLNCIYIYQGIQQEDVDYTLIAQLISTNHILAIWMH